MAMDQHETFNWLCDEKTRLENEVALLKTDRDGWMARCFDIALEATKNNPAIRAEIERCRQAETVDASIFNFVLNADTPREGEK